MSYTNETTYYGIPLPNGSDKSTWTDDNAAKERIDADLHSAVEMSTSASEDIVAIKATVANLLAADIQFQSDLDTANGKIDALQDKETLQDGEIAAVRADAEDMITAYNEPTATSTHAYTAGDYFIYNDVLYQATSSIAIGDTIVPDSNCTTTNVATELSQINSELAKNSISVTADGVKTNSQLLDEIGSQLDFSKLNYSSRLTIGAAGTETIYNPVSLRSNLASMSSFGISNAGELRGGQVIIRSSSSSYFNETGDIGANVPASGTVFTITFN